MSLLSILRALLGERMNERNQFCSAHMHQLQPKANQLPPNAKTNAGAETEQADGPHSSGRPPGGHKSLPIDQPTALIFVCLVLNGHPHRDHTQDVAVFNSSASDRECSANLPCTQIAGLTESGQRTVLFPGLSYLHEERTAEYLLILIRNLIKEPDRNSPMGYFFFLIPSHNLHILKNSKPLLPKFTLWNCA